MDSLQGALQLPFKPFTVEECCALTGCPPAQFDVLRRLLEWEFPDPGMGGGAGYGFMGAFAAFVGWRWHQEGASSDRVMGVVNAVKQAKLEFLQEEFRKGNTFPALTTDGRQNVFVMVKRPKTTLGQRLDLAQLMDEFLDRVERTFPQKAVSGPIPEKAAE